MVTLNIAVTKKSLSLHAIDIEHGSSLSCVLVAQIRCASLSRATCRWYQWLSPDHEQNKLFGAEHTWCNPIQKSVQLLLLLQLVQDTSLELSCTLLWL